MRGRLFVMGSLVAESRAPGVKPSVAVAYSLSCPEGYGISLDQGSNLCPLHWQVLNPVEALGDGHDYHYSHFTDEDTEAQLVWAAPGHKDSEWSSLLCSTLVTCDHKEFPEHTGSSIPGPSCGAHSALSFGWASITLPQAPLCAPLP